MTKRIIVTTTLQDGSQVVKDVPFHEDPARMLLTFERRMKELWRDILYAEYGDKWNDHDPMPHGSFWG